MPHSFCFIHLMEPAPTITHYFSSHCFLSNYFWHNFLEPLKTPLKIAPCWLFYNHTYTVYQKQQTIQNITTSNALLFYKDKKRQRERICFDFFLLSFYHLKKSFILARVLYHYVLFFAQHQQVSNLFYCAQTNLDLFYNFSPNDQ